MPDGTSVPSVRKRRSVPPGGVSAAHLRARRGDPGRKAGRGGFSRRICLGGIFTLTAALWCGTGKAGPRAQILDQSGYSLGAYKNVTSYVDRTPAELIAVIPDLAGLEPAADAETGQKALAKILPRVRENVRQLYERFPNTTSREDITMERLGADGTVDFKRQETFRYLAVAHTTPGVSTLEEYRTDMQGKPAEPTGVENGLVVTKGFASELLFFHPAARLDAFFRYLGRQKLNGQETEVIAFAQRPGWASSTFQIIAEGQSTTVLVQGLAWIDSMTGQIIRMRTDLLAPRPDLGLASDTSVIDFGEVRFPEKPSIVLWLPQNVTVTARWRGESTVTTTVNRSGGDDEKINGPVKWGYQTYRNIHHYSDFRLFGSESKLKF
jgi:hypothetical protein